MNSTTTTATYNPTTFEKRALAGLVITAFALLCLYVFFVNQTVWNVASRQDTAKKINAFAGEVASLEAAYMNESATLTLERAYAMGFVEFSNAETVFVERVSPSVAFR